MSRKRPTQVELERECSELKKRVSQLEKRLKQALRWQRDQNDMQVDMHLALDLEQEQAFQDMMVRTPDDDVNAEFIVFTLPNGQVKKIPKRASNE